MKLRRRPHRYYLRGSPPEELTRLESLRLGLHSETFFNEIPQELHQGMTKAIDPFYDYDPMM